MSFFGFNTDLPRERGHPSNAPGFSQQSDPFPSRYKDSGGIGGDDDDGIEFDDTYDGLGDQLDETDDAFNDETFGGGSGPSQSTAQGSVGRDFDFFGQTAKVSDAILEEQMQFTRNQPAPKTTISLTSSSQKKSSKPKRTGYERYAEHGDIADLQVNPSLWGVAPKKPSGDPGHARQQSSISSAPAKKMMSLEEVEAAMHAQAKKPVQAMPAPTYPHTQDQFNVIPKHYYTPPPQQVQSRFAEQESHPSQDLQFRQPRPQSRHPQQSFQHPHSTQPQIPFNQPSPQPAQLLQHSQGPSQAGTSIDPRLYQEQGVTSQSREGPQSSLPLVTHPEQLLQLTGEQRTAYLMEDAKRAKRNHKIHLLSKDNGLMTPQDKNFITRIQLQQLVTATGNPNERGTDAGLAEDFYYQVHSQIRGPRQNPNQPLNNFAQTYLFQTGSRQGYGGRRHNRGADNHMQRMEQQVQRAVEAAKAKPKNKQLVIEGSLGKISFSNSKTPKPLLNIKRTEPGQEGGRPVSANMGDKSHKSTNRNRILRNLEQSYQLLMEMEDLERQAIHVTPESSREEVESHAEWVGKMTSINKKLWSKLNVMAPIDASSSDIHPFIAFLSFPKGKKAMPRVFRHIDQEQRLFVITVIFVHLGQINAVKLAQIQPDHSQLPLAVREEVELFAQAVIPSIFGYINEAPLNVVTGLFGLLMNSVNVQALSMTKIGVMILTTLVSRAELLKQAGSAEDVEWEQWLSMYNKFFDALEPILAHIFPGSVHSGEDVYVWQFLAAVAIGGNPEQQQRLVLGVRERVLETVKQAKTLPPDVSAQRISHVNLFMRALGLDVDKLG